MKVLITFVVVSSAIGVALAQFDLNWLQSALIANSQGAVGPTGFPFPATTFESVTNAFENFAAPQFQYNEGWTKKERQQRHKHRHHRKPRLHSGRSVKHARPHKPKKHHYKNFHDIYDKLENKSTVIEEKGNEMESTSDDFDGRSIVAPGQYPHMAAIGYPTTENLIEFKCGGSLISEIFVVTAAHCCYLNGDVPVLVEFGIINLKDESGNRKRPQNQPISEIIVHPLYNTAMNYNDIALLRLQEPVFFTKFVKPIRLWARDVIPYDSVFTMGYGSTSFAKAPTNILTELDLSVVPWESCNAVFPPGETSPQGITDSQICAKDFVKHRDTCQGDSGGPLQLNLQRRRHRRGFRFYLVGIISFGEVCGSGSPGVYTKVSSYIDWIASIVWPEMFENF